jgi:c(7)-type cytochrome triheme protein
MKRGVYHFVVCALLTVLSPAAMAAPVVGDVLFVRKTKGDEEFPPAIFPHWVHRVKFKCFVCHSKAIGFEMKAGNTPVTMDAIEEGKYCGACHKGNPAFAVSFETCTRCHRK